MPIVAASTYKPPFFLRNGHLNTLFPFLFRNKSGILYQRERLDTPDNDFVDIDWVKQGNKRLCVLLHGLEGSSGSQYIIGTTKALIKAEWDVAAINFRSCSGEMNKQLTLYHSGFTDDLHFFITNHGDDYDEIYIAGFSLGGNVVMKYISDGRFKISNKIKAVCGISVPCDLNAGSYKIMEAQNHFYERSFIKTLTEKIILKHSLFPDQIDLTLIKHIKTLRDFDDFYTAPIHGYRDASDYYDKCNCLQFLDNIKIPAIIINALDDSFLPKESYPYNAAKVNENLFLMTPKYGGHVGFTTFGFEHYWSESEMIRFFERYTLSS
ncbi:MAG: alpha/beta hydrolase [Saprospiraceae bacterium]|nr:alpha/beta hydrolase [Saprospiraceae bacterium]